LKDEMLRSCLGIGEKMTAHVDDDSQY
jgi:hypothetical protein